MEKTSLEASAEENENQPKTKTGEKLSSNNIKAFCYAVVGLASLALGIAGWIYEKSTYLVVFQYVFGIFNLFMAYRLAFTKGKEGRS